MSEQQTVPNLVQGVSQQSAQARRVTQARLQFDCFNHAVEGATARPPLDLIKKLGSYDLQDAFFYDIIRDDDERYVLCVKDGTLRIFNFLTGNECTIDYAESVSAYLTAAPSGKDWNQWCATSAEDFTFLANKWNIVKMDDDLSDTRPQEALFWFRAGGYKVTYKIRIKLETTWYEWEYETPDNSVEANAAYIQTDAICYAFYNAMVTDPTNPVGDLGFSIERSGNIMRLWREPGAGFNLTSGSVAGSGNPSATGKTWVDRSFTFPNSKAARQIAAYSLTGGNFKFKFFNEDSSTQFDVLYTSPTFTHSGGGWRFFDLPTGAFVSPGAGTIRAGIYWQTGGPTSNAYGAFNRSNKSGEVNGSNQSGFTNSSGSFAYGCPIRVMYGDEVDLEFSIETSDGNNNTQLTGAKGRVSTLNDLPKTGFDGMVFTIGGDAEAQEDDWYARFNSHALDHDSTTQGAWEETVKPGTPTSLDPHTMPLLIKNLAPNLFEVSYGTWGDRLAGDGIDSAKDPSFVERTIEELFYDRSRLGIETRAAANWSRVNNQFVYFPDTVQVQLDTAPIDGKANVTKGIAILRKIVQTNGFTYLWAEGRQLVVNKAEGTVFSNKTLEVLPSSSFTWDFNIQPVEIGSAVLFADKAGRWGRMKEVTYQQGQVLASTGLTDHVPKYVPTNLRLLKASDTEAKAFLYSDDTPNRLYLYEWRLGDNNQRVQSAWNIWRLPKGCRVLHIVLDGAQAYMFIKRSDGTFLYTFSLAPSQEDTEGGYFTRLDLRLRETDFLVKTYDADDAQTTMTIPQAYADELDFTLRPGQTPVMLVVRETAGNYLRGQEIKPVSINLNTGQVVYPGDITGVKFYFGFRIRAIRRESTFYVRNQDTGYVHMQRVQVDRAILSFADTGYTRAEKVNKSGVIVAMEEFEGRTFGDPTAIFDAVTLATAELDFPVAEKNTDCDVQWVNDSWLPSSWGSMAWWYSATQRARPGA